jgi:hypothetical protein
MFEEEMYRRQSSQCLLLLFRRHGHTHCALFFIIAKMGKRGKKRGRRLVFPTAPRMRFIR